MLSVMRSDGAVDLRRARVRSTETAAARTVDHVHRVALVPYQRNWSYDFTAQALATHLAGRFEISVFHDDTLERLNYRELDLVVDFWWRGGMSKRFGERAVTQVSSHRWARNKYGSLTAASMIEQHQRRAGSILVPSERLRGELEPHFEREVAVCPKGFHPETFGDYGARRGGIAIGWAGNTGAPDKRLDVLREACPALRIATGLPYDEMPGFYNSIDVITCASDAEGDPRPLIEGMACGCFPVCTDVGVVPELVRNGDNGLIVERTPEAFAMAFQWCRANLDYVREAGARNAMEMRASRTWQQCALAWGDAFDRAIARAPDWKVSERTERKARVLAALKKRRAARR